MRLTELKLDQACTHTTQKARGPLGAELAEKSFESAKQRRRPSLTKTCRKSVSAHSKPPTSSRSADETLRARAAAAPGKDPRRGNQRLFGMQSTLAPPANQWLCGAVFDLFADDEPRRSEQALDTPDPSGQPGHRTTCTIVLRNAGLLSRFGGRNLQFPVRVVFPSNGYTREPRLFACTILPFRRNH